MDTISRVVDISASQGHIVPTSVAFREGNFFVGNLHPFPVVPGVQVSTESHPAARYRFCLQALQLYSALLSMNGEGCMFWKIQLLQVWAQLQAQVILFA